MPAVGYFHCKDISCLGEKGYSKGNNLLTFRMWTDQMKHEKLNGMQACMTNPTNQNITTTQKELGHWHCLQQLINSGTLGESSLAKAAGCSNLPHFSVVNMTRQKGMQLKQQATFMRTNEQRLKCNNLYLGLKCNNLYLG